MDSDSNILLLCSNSISFATFYICRAPHEGACKVSPGRPQADLPTSIWWGLSLRNTWTRYFCFCCNTGRKILLLILLQSEHTRAGVCLLNSVCIQTGVCLLNSAVRIQIGACLLNSFAIKQIFNRSRISCLFKHTTGWTLGLQRPGASRDVTAGESDLSRWTLLEMNVWAKWKRCEQKRLQGQRLNVRTRIHCCVPVTSLTRQTRGWIFYGFFFYISHSQTSLTHCHLPTLTHSDAHSFTYSDPCSLTH